MAIVVILPVTIMMILEMMTMDVMRLITVIPRTNEGFKVNSIRSR